ncbi:LCP family protein [Anaerotignum neopropionicum]|nr:LCP family protein [Anaerotignum neopropionicum]
MDKKRRRSAQPTEKNSSKKKGFHPIKVFFKIVLTIVLVFVMLAGGACFAYYKTTGKTPFANDGVTSINGSDTSFLDAFLKRNIKLNVAVFGVDKDGTRTDVIFVVHYDSAAQSISLVSLPRDTRVSLADKVKENIKAEGRSYSQVTKLNSVHAYSGNKIGCQNTVLQIEDLLGIKIDHYVKIDLEAFRAIVDAIGGVDMYVPQDMYKDMRDTGDPLINLKEGDQHLDGEKAEQLVRFRGYAEGDVGRIEVQQIFLKALADKVLSTETILKNLPDLISVMYKYIETDVSLPDALKYVNYIDKVDMSKISMETLPGVGQYVGDVSYFLHDAEATGEMVERVFYSVAPEESQEGTTADSKSLLIEVTNGGNINGLAAQYSKKLEDSGYRVASPSNYSGQQNTYTRIQVKNKGVGSDLIAFFTDAKVEVAPKEIGSDIDIRIILGTKEQ